MMQKAATGDAQCVPVSSRNTGWQHQRPQEDASPLQTLLGRRTGTAGEGRLLHSYNSITSSALSFATGNSDGGQSDREYLLRSFFFSSSIFWKVFLAQNTRQGKLLGDSVFPRCLGTQSGLHLHGVWFLFSHCRPSATAGLALSMLRISWATRNA